MKIGDLVQPVAGREFTQEPQVGIVLEVIDDVEVPPVVKVLWRGGHIGKEWTDELEVVNISENKIAASV